MRILITAFCFLLASCGAKKVSVPVTETQWDQFFPQRWGTSQIWKETYTNLDSYYPAMEQDYYSYENFVAAISELRNIKLREVALLGTVTVYRMDTRTDKDWKEIYSYPADGEYVYEVDFSQFANRTGASEQDKDRELAAFLANISHEVAEPRDGTIYPLFYREELAYERSPEWGVPTNFYQDTNFTWFAPSQAPTFFREGHKDAGQIRFTTTSYHGRGPIQLRWNFNYGAFSAAVFGDPEVLLKNPDMLLDDGKLAMMSAIWFWMMPQAPKPAIHEVMYKDTFKPTHISNWGFGHAVVLLNGFYESGAVEGGAEFKDQTVTRRINFYRQYADNMGVTVGFDDEQLDTQNMSPYTF
ncbi:MAG: chitinase [Brevinema sp.]